MELKLTPRFLRAYQQKSSDQQERINKTLDFLSTNPRHPSLHSHKVGGTRNIFECYSDDGHRVTFQYGDNCIILRNNCEHNLTLKRP
jgi:hypothetical protein